MRKKVVEMLIGSDISQFNPDVPQSGFGDFQIHRMAIGSGYVDSGFDGWWTRRRELPGALNGIYHVLTLDDPIPQCDYVMNSIRKYGVDECIFAVDYEGETAWHDDECECLHGFISNITRRFELIQPLIYCDMTALYHIMRQPCFEYFQRACSWWIADWNGKDFSNLYYNTVKAVMRQFTNQPLCDLDMFFGSAEGWKSLCFKRWLGDV